MRNTQQILTRIIAAALLPVLLLSTSCTIEPIKDPNNPGLDPISQNPTIGEIQNVVTGLESGMRDAMGFYWDDVGVVGREFYRFSGSDPRFTSDLPGAIAELDNNGFYTTNPFAARYRVVKNANILIEGLGNTTSSDVSAEQKTVGIAYAKTIQAHELLLNLNLQWDNGIRVDVADPNALGPFLSRAESLNAIIGLLNDAYTALAANPTVTFPFNSVLFGNDAATFAQFNRALAARCAVYNSDWAGALSALDDSFFDLNGDFFIGAYYLYSSAGGDQVNPLFFPLNSNGETRVAQPDFITDAEAGDTRLNKVSHRATTAFQDDFSSDYDFFVYKSNTEKVPIIRNEELILIYAEAKIQLGGAGNLSDAVDALNIVRNAAGLPDYSGTVAQPQLITEMLKQRRYSLYGEGHRWIDLRRYNLLATLPIDRPGDKVWPQFPRPANE